MAITFTTGTINQPDAGSVGLAMVEQIRDDIVAHPAWELVEEFTAASGVVRWYVFKCLAAESGLPYDYYVVFSRRLSDGQINAFLCEEYTAATHLAKFYCPYGYSTIFAFDSSGRHTQEFTLGSAALTTTSQNPSWVVWTPSGTSTKWWIAVDDDGFSIAFNGPSNGYFHFGAYTPMTQMPIDFPLQYCGRDAAQGARGHLTRNPALADISYQGAGLFFNGGEGSSISGQSLGFCGDLRYNDKLQNNERSVSECGMTINSYNTGDQAICGYSLGKQKRMRWTVFPVPSGMAFGDAYVLNGTLWVPYQPGDQKFFDTGVPSS